MELLDLLGSGYMVDHCIAAFNYKQERRNYEIYMSDAAQTLINMWSENGEYPRYYDIIHPKKEDDRTGDEIAADVIMRHGLKVVDA